MARSALAIETREGSYRYYSYPVTVFGIPAAAFVPFLVALFPIALWKFAVAAVIGLFFWVIGRFGYTPRYAMYALRARLAGPVCSRTHMLGARRMTRT